MRLIVVGAGRVGLSLAADLAAADLFDRVAVAGRRVAAPPFLRRVDGVSYLPPAPDSETGGSGASGSGGRRPADIDPPSGRSATVRLAEALGETPARAVLVFAVPDDALAAAAAGWAAALRDAGLPAPAVVLHTSGFHPAGILEPLAEGGAGAGGWHPLVALAGPRRGAFRDRTVGVEGTGRAAALGDAIAKAVGARPVRVRPGEKARWHAAAVLASNCLVACLSAAVRELAAASEGRAGLEDLLPLARSALEEVAARGLTEGLTGPIVRGDAKTVAGHLAALDPAAVALYRPLAAELLRVAAPRLDADARRALRAVLAGSAAPARVADAHDFEPEPG